MEGDLPAHDWKCRLAVPVTCWFDTAEEVSIDDAGGVLQRFAQDVLARDFEEFSL